MPHRNGQGIALLADRTRREIIAVVALGPVRPSRIARRLSLSEPAISRQLRLMEAAGLVERHPIAGDRRAIWHTVDPHTRRQILAWLAGTDVGLGPTSPDQSGETGPQIVDLPIVHPKRNDRDR